MTTAHEFLEKLKNGSLDESTRIAVWQLVRQLNGVAKIDLCSPKPGWSLTVEPLRDARYGQIAAHGEPSP